MKKLVPQGIKNVYHLLNAVLANFWHSFPSKKIKVIGVTGTNGKTTTVQMITKILEKAGHKVAMSSTINFKLGDKQWVNKSKFTTLSSWKIQKFIKEAVGAGCEYIVIETSSHSLDQNRVWGVDYDVAVITNVTREHLDYHSDMERYRKAKLLLFKRLRNNFQFCLLRRSSRFGCEGRAIFNFQSIFKLKFSKNRKKISIINLNMEKPKEFLEVEVDEIYGYKIPNSKSQIPNNIKYQIPNVKTVVADNVALGLDKTEFSVGGVNFGLNLIGQFNIENALAAVCVGLSQGIELKRMAEALLEIRKVPGRMDYVENNLGLKIIIDYALTPDSMGKLGKLVSEMKNNNKVFWIFGSCGQRDRGKRPMMGEIVAKHADYAIVTNEDPYGEDPQRIIDEVFSGVIKNGKMKEGENCWRIMDRREAIKKAIEMARTGDIILVTGKGAEETMMIGSEMIPWNDRDVIGNLLVDLQKTGQIKKEES